MTTEEKARAYDEALKRAKKEYSNNLDNAYKNYRERLEYIFHELKESGEDRIREELIEHIKANCESDFILFKKFSPDDVIAWLEKQGKQKPKKVSIWKHWTGGGIAGGSECEQIFLIKIGNVYSISSCLGYECDYIELSELDKLMREEKQGKPNWTEEDECYMGECISAIATKDCWSFEEKRKTKHWLKSLKQRMEE